jgi:cytochrome b involved in lipid metabolism
MNKTIIIGSVILLATLGIFGFNIYQQNKIAEETKELEVLKNTPEEEKCLVTIRDETYDLTTFKSKHPGGDVFKCGSDMTEAFNKQHGDSQLRDIQKYKVTE